MKLTNAEIGFLTRLIQNYRDKIRDPLPLEILTTEFYTSDVVMKFTDTLITKLYKMEEKDNSK
jgi:hypothetical protein